MKSIEVEVHSKRLSDFDLGRVLRAQAQGFDLPVTAYLNHVFIAGQSAVGVVFGHVRKRPNGQFEDGHFIRTSDIVSAGREGRFWVLTTLNSRYVIVTFRRDIGRHTLREYLLSKRTFHAPPQLLQ
jgi:hypothetical protein